MKKIIRFFKKLFGIKEKGVPTGVKFGWKRDLPDYRDFKFKIEVPHELPPLVDMRDQCPPVYNQGDLGSCSANSIGGAFQFEKKKLNKPDWIPSRLYIYYNTRVIEGTVNEDSGATMRNAIKSVVDKGACPEDMWPYKICKFKKQPSEECYIIGSENQVTEYLRISPHTIYDVKHCLSDGYPVAFGFMIYESFMSDEVARTGIAPMPKPNESALGGHAVLAVGYDDSKNALIVRNSWGTEWGLDGYFYMPYEYITTPNMSADFWTIRMVE